MSTLVENVEKVKSAHAALSASIEAKGVSVPAGTKLTGMPDLVDQIQTGGLEPNTSKVTLHSDGSTHIDVNRIIVADTSQMTSFDGFFAEDKKLTSVSFPADFAPNAINMNGFFYQCNSIKNINIPPNFAPNATTFENFCYSCTSLSSFEYSEDFGQKAESVTQFFWGCQNLSSVIIPPNFADVKYAQDIVGNCRNLTSITFPSNFGHKISSSWGFVQLFNFCDNLTEIYGDLALSINFAIENTKVSHDSLIRVLNSIPTVTESRSIKLGNTNIAKLTDEEKKIATDKGWNLVN